MEEKAVVNTYEAVETYTASSNATEEEYIESDEDYDEFDEYSYNDAEQLSH